MAASGNETTGKMFPSATLDDQEKIKNMEMPPVKVSTPPFSSLNPATDGIRMQLIDAETPSAAEASMEASATDDADKKAEDWKAEIEAAESVEELDAVAERYSETGADYKTVQAALDKKYEELSNDDDS